MTIVGKNGLRRRSTFEPRRQRSYDHRLRELVYHTGDLSIATDIGVPRSTAAGWIRNELIEVVTLDVLNNDQIELQAELLQLRRRVRILGIVVGLLLALLRVSGFKLNGRHLLEGEDRNVLKRVVERARAILPLHAVLRVLHISSSRFHRSMKSEAVCGCHASIGPARRPSIPAQLRASTFCTNPSGHPSPVP